MKNATTAPAQLSDRRLLAQVKHLARCESETTADLVAHLAELDERRLFLAEGCSSLFTYCTQVLHLSEHAAYGRIEAARVGRRFPVILELLANQSVHLTTVGLLAAHLTKENHRELLHAAQHQSKRQVEELVASIRPRPDVPSAIRKLPVSKRGSESPSAAKHAAELAVAGQEATELAGVGSPVEPGRSGCLPGPPNPADVADPPTFAEVASKPATVVALAPGRYKVQFTASAATHAKLRQAQDLLRHQIPDGDLSAVFDQALTVFLQHLEKRKFAATDRPRRSRGTATGSRDIPAAVKRTVWKRDGGRCAFVGENGRRCREKGFLEFHHAWPHGDGGPPTVANVQLRCKAHNQYEAELYYGPGCTPAREVLATRKETAARKKAGERSQAAERNEAAGRGTAPGDEAAARGMAPPRRGSKVERDSPADENTPPRRRSGAREDSGSHGSSGVRGNSGARGHAARPSEDGRKESDARGDPMGRRGEREGMQEA